MARVMTALTFAAMVDRMLRSPAWRSLTVPMASTPGVLSSSIRAPSTAASAFFSLWPFSKLPRPAPVNSRKPTDTSEAGNTHALPQPITNALGLSSSGV